MHAKIDPAKRGGLLKSRERAALPRQPFGFPSLKPKAGKGRSIRRMPVPELRKSVKFLICGGITYACGKIAIFVCGGEDAQAVMREHNMRESWAPRSPRFASRPLGNDRYGTKDD
jgi:hypothetical protein